jgi:hypothetical protein
MEGEAAWPSTLLATRCGTRRIDIPSLRIRSRLPFKGELDA